MNLDAQERAARARAQEAARGASAAASTPRADGRPTEEQMREKAKLVRRLRGNNMQTAPPWAIRSWRTTRIMHHFVGSRFRAREFQYTYFLEEMYPELLIDEEQSADSESDADMDSDAVLESDADSESDAESESDVPVVSLQGFNAQRFFQSGQAGN